MSTPTRDELAERAVACKHWRWMEGAAVFNPDMPNIWYPRIGGERAPRYPFLLPDLTDPATLGCLLHLVREAWEPHRGDDSIPSTMQIGDKWAVGTLDGSTLACIVLPAFDTEAEALVAALEAAP